uniref:STAS domain-containing protein n=1 Tax=Plectus sambesii TaxID=2011161 RepID=A0A914WQB0_9BILA
MVGIVQLLMAVFRLSFLTAYLSDQLIGGFTTGAACHVFASQLNKVIGVPVKKYNGLFDLYYTLRDIVEGVPHTNMPTLVVSIVAFIFLLVGKEIINPKVRKHSPVPIPFELIAVIVATAASHFFNFEGEYKISVVSHIPTGFPEPKLPRLDLIPQLLGDAVSVAVVTFVVTVSVGKLFAKKHGYVIDSMQELRALGAIQCIVSTLSCHPASGGLTRSVLNSQIGVKTQISCLFSGSLLLVVILWLGPLLEPLPMCVLSCIIIIALKGMFMQLLDLKTLWPVSKIDFAIWLVSFVATAGWDVTEGLIISVVFALFTVIFRLQWPKTVELGRLPHSDLYRDVTRYNAADLVEGVRVMRFDSPLLFTNIEIFKRRAHKLVEPREQPVKNGSRPVKALVIDGSGFTCIDCMGVGALKEVSQEMKSKGVKVYFASCKAPVRDLFESSGFYEVVPKARFYPSIHDAIIYALCEGIAEKKEEQPISQISHL